MYGLDFSECRFVTDHKGNKLRADIHYSMFSMLVEFRQAALAAQTRHIEKSVRPGAFKGSLASSPCGVAESLGNESTGTPLDRQTPPNPRVGRREAFEALFSEPVAPIVTAIGPDVLSASEQVNDAPTLPVVDAAPATSRYIRHVFFPREFRAPVPDEVAAAIKGGTYFLRAWREYRKFTAVDAAELTGLSDKTVIWHEQGYNSPGKETLKRFAEIYDCSPDQLSAISNSEKARKEANYIKPDKMAPVDTDYPDTVLDHIRAGKSPVIAWRIYRRMTDKYVADGFGTSVELLTRMIGQDRMSDRVLKKFAQIFHCSLDQLRRPEGLVVEPHKVRAMAAFHLTTNTLQAANAA
jgi:transcriptional regulator with XRE-family HTH domain